MAFMGSQKHGIPALLSFLSPGVGQIVKRHILKGAAMMFSFIGLVAWYSDSPGFSNDLEKGASVYEVPKTASTRVFPHCR